MFGQVPMRKQYECICPNCQRNLAASRFAPHLEKCMGMGRNSSRIASRRSVLFLSPSPNTDSLLDPTQISFHRIQANHGRKESDDSDADDNDNDWSYLADKKGLYPLKPLKAESCTNCGAMIIFTAKRLKKEKNATTNSPRRSKQRQKNNGQL